MARLNYGLYVSSRHDRLEILDSNKRAAIYVAKIQSKKTQISVFRQSEQLPFEELVAVVTFRRFSSKVDIRMRDGSQGSLYRKTVLSTTYKFETEGIEWNWKREGLISGNLRLIDMENNETIAKLTECACQSRRQLCNMAILVG